jgi:hypothetical protein
VSTTDTTVLEVAPTRSDDPRTSHDAARVAVKRVPTKLAVERALEAMGRPATSDEIHRFARFELGYYCTPQRVRTVLAEYAAGGKMVGRGHPVSFTVTGEYAPSENGNDARLWTLAGGA